MPSRHKKRKSLKQKNKSSAPPSSHENGTKGKEKHSIPHKEAVGNGNKEKRVENSIFEFKEAETASASEMETSRNEGSSVAAIAKTEIPSESENSQNFDVFEIPEIDKSSNELYENDKSQSFESNEFSEEFVARNDEVGWTGGLEEKGSEDMDVKDCLMDNSFEEAIESLVKECVPVNKQGEAEQSAAKKDEGEKKDKVMIAAHGFMEAPDFSLLVTVPSRHKKRMKQKNKSSAPPSSHENGTKDKEKHSIPQKDAVGDGNKKKRGENSIFEFKAAETASASEMDTSRNEGSPVAAAIAKTEILPESEYSQNFDVFEIPEIDKSSNDLHETDKSQSFESNGFSEEFVAKNDEVGWTCGLEEKGSEDKDVKDSVMDNSFEEGIKSLVKDSVPVNKKGEVEQSAAKKDEVIFAHEVDASVCEKKDEVTIAAHGSMEAAQDGERDVILPRIEIFQPPLAVRRASIWNCCGLFEVIKAFLH